jgi:hypothetical protein
MLLLLLTTYYRAFLTKSMQYSESFKQAFAGPYAELTAYTNKPIAVAELSTVSYGTVKETWYVCYKNKMKNKHTKNRVT